MSMRKKIVSAAVALILGAGLILSGCGGKQEEFQAKPETGIAPAFSESLGYFNENPSVITLSETEKYVYYTRNDEKFSDESEYIAVRRATLSGGVWQYEEPMAALIPSDGGWDGGRVFQADVVCGNFLFNGEEYGFLMAYAGNSLQNSRRAAQIGLAVSKSAAGPFVRISEQPFLTWSADDYSQYGQETTDGVNEPSLVSYDKASKILLFYSLYNPNTVDSCRFLTLDLSSDLSELAGRKGERGNVLSNKGVADMETNSNCVGADFALTEDGQTLVCVRDYNPIAATSPAVAQAVQVLSAPVQILMQTIGDASPAWTILNDKISSLDTAVWEEDGKPGYDRIYSACIVSDGYARIANAQEFSLMFTSSSVAAVNAAYKYTPMLHDFAVSAEVTA